MKINDISANAVHTSARILAGHLGLEQSSAVRLILKMVEKFAVPVDNGLKVCYTVSNSLGKAQLVIATAVVLAKYPGADVETVKIAVYEAWQVLSFETDKLAA